MVHFSVRFNEYKISNIILIQFHCNERITTMNVVKCTECGWANTASAVHT